MRTIINGKELANTILAQCKEQIATLQVQPTLAVILVGDNAASHLYVKIKEKACNEVGITIKKHIFKEATTEEIIQLINQLNNSEASGILVQLPLPEHLDKNKILSSIELKKDVDFLNPQHFGTLLTKNNAGPCTPQAIMRMFDAYKIDLKGKSVCIINHSNLIGKPLSLSLLKRYATVSVCHDQTKNLLQYTKNADIIISATGVPNIITGNHVKDNVILIDAGISKVDGKIQGDIHTSAQDRSSYFTKVPGGVGPMTVALLIENITRSAKNGL